MKDLNVQQAIAKLTASLSNADSSFDAQILYGDEWADPEWQIENCFIELLAIIEAIELEELHKMVLSEYLSTKDSDKGFLKTKQTPDGEPFSAVIARIRQYLRAVRQFYTVENSTTITKDLIQILRDIHYTITDKTLFGSVPTGEKDVHLRIEGILRCVFPDLKHKPVLSKAIKNFEPDTGIPSIATLIEYKFLSQKKNITIIADELLADTRGYVSKEWNRFVYVIYETNRFRPEKEWIQLIRQSGVPENTTVVILSGEPSRKKTINRNLTQSKRINGR